MKGAQAAHVFQRLEALNPHPQGELDYTNPFTLLVAVVLSAQATDKGVNRVTQDLFKIVSTPQDLLDLGFEALKEKIKSIGLYQTKARNLMGLAKILCEKYGGQVPGNRESLMSLPGVGRKTANVVLNIAFGHLTMAVDTHVFRVSHRLGLAKGKTPEKVETELMSIIPTIYQTHAHLWLILHGRYICKARMPLCQTCPLNDICPYPSTDLMSSITVGA